MTETQLSIVILEFPKYLTYSGGTVWEGRNNKNFSVVYYPEYSSFSVLIPEYKKAFFYTEHFHVDYFTHDLAKKTLLDVIREYS